jgi:hypothetical protein
MRNLIYIINKENDIRMNFHPPFSRHLNCPLIFNCHLKTTNKKSANVKKLETLFLINFLETLISQYFASYLL